MTTQPENDDGRQIRPQGAGRQSIACAINDLSEENDMQPSPPRTTRRRSIAWVFYLVLTVASLFAVGPVGPQVLILTAILAAYTVYLYRGGRFVIFFF